MTPPIIFLSRQKLASKVLEQGLVQNKFSVGKPTAMGLQTVNVSRF